MYTFKKRIVAAILSMALALLTTASFAQDISFTAEVNSNKVTLGSSIELIMTINGVKDIGEMTLPKLKGFDVRYIGPTTHVSIVNGEYSSSKSFMYSLFPQKTGKYVIQPFSTTLKGKVYKTEPIEIEVLDAAGLNATTQGSEVRLKDKINLVLRVPKNEIYINERLSVKIMLLVTGLSVRDIRFPEIDNIGFSIGEFEHPRQYQQTIQGMRYDIVEFDTVVYPTRTGELTLGPAHLESNLLVKAQSSRRSLGRLFNDDFFDSFFDRQEKRPIRLASEPVTINVLDLPEEGKPDDFSGAVGNFDFEATASPVDVRVGDPITLKMNVKGRSNLKAVKLPEFDDDKNFKIYKPIIKEEKNTITLEQVIIPKSDEIEEIPAIEFSYFDAELKKYRTLKKGPFPIRVSPLEEGQSFSAVGLPGPIETLQPEKLGEDIVFIKNNIGRLSRVGQPLYKSFRYYGFLFFFLSLWLASFIYYKRTYRLATDAVYAKKLKAPKEAKKGLMTAKKFLHTGKLEEFYNMLFKTLQHYLADKFHIPSGAVTVDNIQKHLKAENVQLIKDIKAIFEECDMVRYASGTINEERMMQSFEKAEDVIDQLERLIK